MNNLANEINFTDLKDNFDSIYEEVNDNNNTVTLNLKNNRKVFIMSEENCNNVSRFLITNIHI